MCLYPENADEWNAMVATHTKRMNMPKIPVIPFQTVFHINISDLEHFGLPDRDNMVFWDPMDQALDVSWGDAELTLIWPARLLNALKQFEAEYPLSNVYEYLAEMPEGSLIDMEH